MDENSGFVAYPLPFTVQGVRLDLRIRSYKRAHQRRLGLRIGRLTIFLTSSAEPGSIEQADDSALQLSACEMSDKYSGAGKLLINFAT